MYRCKDPRVEKQSLYSGSTREQLSRPMSWIKDIRVRRGRGGLLISQNIKGDRVAKGRATPQV